MVKAGTSGEVKRALELKDLLSVFDYTVDEMGYGVNHALENHPEDDLNGAIIYIERDLRKNPKYLCK